ncbi:MAG: DUF4412 domain-containing protein [Bacteroidota bacterium]|nr:DUF4412 domain-containing protein [Bacteroidota bacterium]
MINFLFSLFLFISAPVNHSPSFEGKIKLVEETHYNTIFYTYTIKNKQIKVDKFNQNHKIIQSLLINLEDEQIIVLSPSKKKYTYLNLSRNPNTANENFEVIKTENTRILNGKKCYQWRVRNVEQNTEVAYWVSESNFYFFNDFIKLLNCSEHTFTFFEKIPDSQVFFPMYTVERTLLRKIKKQISVIEINHQKVNDTTFEIPKDFNEVEY